MHSKEQHNILDEFLEQFPKQSLEEFLEKPPEQFLAKSLEEFLEKCLEESLEPGTILGGISEGHPG